MVIDYNVAS